jgi:hypothetical protein
LIKQFTQINPSPAYIFHSSSIKTPAEAAINKKTQYRNPRHQSESQAERIPVTAAPNMLNRE